jgi:hypothetical protein
MAISSPGFALISSNLNSSLNFLRQLSTVGSTLLKIQSFLVSQILHAIKMMISIAKGTDSLSLMFLKMWGTGLVETKVIPRELHQALAKLHRRKRWAPLSNLCKMQRSQVKESRAMFFLFSRSLVVSLSFKSNQRIPCVSFDIWISKSIDTPDVSVAL